VLTTATYDESPAITGARSAEGSARRHIARFIESPSPTFIAMTDVRTRSLADRRVTTRYDFAVLNRRHVVAATQLLPGMTRGREVL
jgi:hypothetical protein